ncbi:MAG: type 2 lantipeptide synthetase LanM [Caulobacter sp.]|nr:type 2 lantipeptide synthetase LanM [Caulobacter sp.]
MDAAAPVDTSMGKGRRAEPDDRLNYLSDLYFGKSGDLLEEWRKVVEPFVDQERLALGKDADHGDGQFLQDVLKEYSESWTKTGGIKGEVDGPLSLTAPFVARARRAILESLSRLSPWYGLDREAIADAFVRGLRGRFEEVVNPSVAVALNLWRVSGRLSGETPEDRARDFFLGARDPVVRRQIVELAPVLDTILAGMTRDTMRAWDEVIRALADDREALVGTFDLPGLALQDVEFGLGDAHAGGRCVTAITLSGRRVIYKPRSLAADSALNAVYEWINGQTDLDLPTIRILPREHHGWVEHISAAECGTNSQIQGCFQRIGALLCISYICGLNDVHNENIICAGEYPYLIDQETLMFPDAALVGKAGRVVSQVRSDSVLRIGYLPHPFELDGVVVDMSGATMLTDQKGPVAARLARLDRDDAGLEDIQIVIRAHLRNAPRLRGAPASPVDHLSQITAGFERAYQALLRGRSQLLKAGGAMAGFADVTSRFVVRGTAEYARALRGSYHPRYLRSDLDHTFAFAPLVRHDGRSRRDRIRVLQAELADLKRGDIPIFHSAAQSRDLLDSRGRRIANFFSRSGFDTLKRRLRNLGEDDLQRQLDLLRSAFHAPLFGFAARAPTENISAYTDDSVLLDRASAIGWHLRKRAFIASGIPVWATIEKHDNYRGRVELTNFELYDGVGGVGTFLAELAAATQCRQTKDLARRCLNAVRLPQDRRTRGIGAFNGLAGRVYADLRMSSVLEDDNIVAVRRRLARIRTLAKGDLDLDLISGCAGAALVALRASRLAPIEDLALETAQVCAQRLVATAHREDGLAWWRPQGLPEKLTGLSHGVAGIAVALASTAKATAAPALAELAWEALAYEATTFDSASGLWPDLRGEENGVTNRLSMAWCHGTPGIGLSRQIIADLSLHGTPSHVESDLRRAREAVKQAPALNFDSLCHGELGNIEVLRCGDADDFQWGLDRAKSLAASNRTVGDWLLETPGHPPGMMTGLAGIGSALLGWYDRSAPSVLALELRS